MKIQIVNYPGAMQTATQGLYEMFMLANLIAEEHGLAERFDMQIIEVPSLAAAKSKKQKSHHHLAAQYRQRILPNP